MPRSVRSRTSLPEAVGLAAEITEQMRGTPAWCYVESMAHTLAYDGEVLGGAGPDPAPALRSFYTEKG
jgi:hypothetical protein